MSIGVYALAKAARAFKAGLALLALGSAAAAPAWAHRGHAFGNPFHDLSLTEACELARDEHKLVFVYVTRPNELATDALEQPTWSVWRAIDLLIRETVAVRLDSGRDADALRPYELGEPPTVLLLESDGRLVRRLPGDAALTPLMNTLEDVLSSDKALARVRAALQDVGQDDPLARERLADALARHGDPAAALRHYRWCIEVGLQKQISYAAARRRLVMNSLVQLGEPYAPARQAAEEIRDKMEAALLGGEDNANLARDLAALNRALGDESRTLSLFDRLPKRSRARYTLFDRVFEQLVEQKRYADILALADPSQTFRQEVFMARQNRGLWDDSPDAPHTRGQRAFVVRRGACLVEALAATGRTAAARKLIDAVLRFDDRAETLATLRSRAARADAPDVLAYLEALAARKADP